MNDLKRANDDLERVVSGFAEARRLDRKAKTMKRILIFIATALVTLIILGLIFDTPPLPATPPGPTETPRRLTPAEQRDSVTPGKRIGNG